MCPECDSAIDVDEEEADVGDELTCSECGALLRVGSIDPVELELSDDDDLDDEDDDEVEEDDDELEDDDEDDDGLGDDE
jgi:DNA-directed RNA polymerase subunit M/transcription elongation factor TFIIS